MLDENVKPQNYNIDLDVDLKKFAFFGKETIKLNIEKRTEKFVLHSADLKINSLKLVQNGKEVGVSFKLDEKKEEMIVNLKEKISGDCELLIEFVGKLSEGLAGFYRSKYFVEGKEKYLATTQFEPADARRAFVCFDEPKFKATFDIAFRIDENLEAISNMPIKEEKEEGKKKRIVFSTTPRMSTYLIYFGIGEFEYLEAKQGKTNLRVYTTPGKKEHGKFALECAKKFLKFYNDYFDVPYALPKLDQLAIPDFASGAMENWGAITYREVELLFDEKTNSSARKHRVAEVIAHEMAHQWFGNLVTMEWWNDLWLNESFATWMAYKVVDKHFPKWNMWSQFVDNETVGALNLDSLKSSHPIEVEVHSPEEVNQIFDAISYNKGGSILRMLETYLGENKFREGLRAYMKKHAYSNAITKDLWDALGKASGENVSEMMSGWTSKVGYPVLSAELNENSLVLKQERFLFEENSKSDNWTVPLQVRFDSGKPVSLIMKEKERKIDLKKPSKYAKVNLGQSAFYRVNYSAEILDSLKELVENNKLDSLDRWGIQNDLYALTKAGKISFNDYLDFIAAYRNEKDYLVCSDVIGNLYSVYFLSSGILKENVKIKATEICKSFLKWLGWDAKRGEDENYSKLRNQVLVQLARMQDTKVLEEGKKRFEEFLQSDRALSPDLKAAVFAIAGWKGDINDWNKFREMYKKANNPEDERRLLSALGGFEDEKLLAKTLDFSLSKDVRGQDAFIPFLSVARNPNGRELAWPWSMKNWSELKKRYGKGGGLKMFETFVSPIGILTDIKEEKEIEKFFNKEKESRKLVEQSLTQSLEKLRVNYNFLKNNNGF